MCIFDHIKVSWTAVGGGGGGDKQPTSAWIAAWTSLVEGDEQLDWPNRQICIESCRA